MQKKIIALAIASALVAPAMAFAEASVSGQVNMSIDMKKDGNTTEASTNVLSSNNSRLIFKGSEDLGSGLSAVWQLDSRFNVDTGSATTLFGGNDFLGLKSDSMGTLLVGKIDSPYKTSTRGLDVFFDVAGDNRSNSGAGAIAGLLSHDARLDNTLNYTSPNMGGFSIAAATVFGAEAAAANTTKGSLYSLAGMYSMDAIYATLAYQTTKFGSAATGDLGAAGGFAVDDESNALKLGGGFKTDAFVVNALIERPTNKVAATSTSGTNYYLGGRFNISSSDGVRAAFTRRGTFGTVGDAKQYAIGYSHDMSKATSVYATYVKTTDNNTGAADPSALSFGMKHAF